jgi:hypothetical protein
MPNYTYLFTIQQQKEATRQDKYHTHNINPKKDYWGSEYTKEWKDSSFNDKDAISGVEDQFQVKDYDFKKTSWLAKNKPELAAEVDIKLKTKDFQRYLASEQKELWLDKKIARWNEIIGAEKQEIENRNIQINYIKEGRLYPPRNIITRTFPILNVKAIWHRRKLERANFLQNKIIKKQEALSNRFVLSKKDIAFKNDLYESNNTSFFNDLNKANNTYKAQQALEAANKPAPAPVIITPAPVAPSTPAASPGPALIIKI